MFSDAQGLNISGGQFNNVGRDQINNTTTHYHLTDRKPATFHDLYEEVKDVGASYDSETRYPQPQCHPDTRQDVLKLLLDWIHSTSPSDRMLWLYGPAGAGKSAIAQTIAQTAREENILVASFFFSRADPKRNNPRYIFLSIAYQLAHSIPELREPIERAIRKNPAILQGTLENQFAELILEPCRSLPQLARNYQGTLVIDGIDECNGSSAQQRILFIMATALSEKMPYRTLLCSRPEPSIRESFNTEIFRLYLRRIALDDTFAVGRDIAIFLNSEFKRIRGSPRNCHIEFPNLWPSPSVVDELVQKASGQFIYADTVIKFVDNEYANPCARLEIVLCPKSLSDPDMGSPFHDLDTLYHQILSTNPHRSKLRDILRVLVLAPQIWPREPRPTPRNMEALLMLPVGEVLLTLRGMHSILHIDGPDDEIRILHASFEDSLRDEIRSGYFFVGNVEDQHSFVAWWLLHAIDYHIQNCGGREERLSQAQRNVLFGAWGTWGICCSKSSLDDKTLDAIRNANFTRSLGSYIQQGIEMLSSTGFSTETSGIQRVSQLILIFFDQTERLLERLRRNNYS
ncbi:nwd2 [Moniliophthora roreri]|nr:nwd2 [Moniliophthora roreri]